MWQAKEIFRLLHKHPRGQRIKEQYGTIEIHTEASLGDIILNQSLATLASSNPGIFTKELETGLLGNGYDIAVHSLKDMPTTLPPGLILAGIGKREDPRDAFMLAIQYKDTNVQDLSQLPSGAIIGTSSLRREALLHRDYPHLFTTGVRGNLNTRLKKLDKLHITPHINNNTENKGTSNNKETGEPTIIPDAATRAERWTASSVASSSASTTTETTVSSSEQHYDALILASAGLVRMGWGERITRRLSPRTFPYGVGQGSLGIECRENDETAASLARCITHGPSALRCLTERYFMNYLQGGCQVPIGVHTYYDGVDIEDNDNYPVVENYRSLHTVSGTTTTTPSKKHNPLPSPLPDTDGTPAAPERVRTLTITGTVLSVDGSRCITASITEPVIVPDTEEYVPTITNNDDSTVPCVVITKIQWDRMVEDGQRIGRLLGERIVKAGAGEILGSLTTKRPVTYGAAEVPLDRPESSSTLNHNN